jgi:hypothetical protein
MDKEIFEIVDATSVVFSGYSEEQTGLAYDIMTGASEPEPNSILCGVEELDLVKIGFVTPLRFIKVIRG